MSIRGDGFDLVVTMPQWNARIRHRLEMNPKLAVLQVDHPVVGNFHAGVEVSFIPFVKSK